MYYSHYAIKTHDNSGNLLNYFNISLNLQNNIKIQNTHKYFPKIRNLLHAQLIFGYDHMLDENIKNDSKLSILHYFLKNYHTSNRINILKQFKDKNDKNDDTNDNNDYNKYEIIEKAWYDASVTKGLPWRSYNHMQCSKNKNFVTKLKDIINND